MKQFYASLCKWQRNSMSSCCKAILLAAFVLMSSVSFAQTLTTDRSDYVPGSIVTLTGSGFGPNENVTLRVTHNPTTAGDATDPNTQPWTATANPNGDFTAIWDVPSDQSMLGASLKATADGQPSGSYAEALFTDGNGTGVVTVFPRNGSCLDSTSGNQVYDWEVAEGNDYTMKITGISECGINGEGSAITVFVQNSLGSGGNFCFNATWNGSAYVGHFTTPDPGCFTMPVKYKCGANLSCDNADAWSAQGKDGQPSVHLRNSIFDGNCVKTANDENCDPVELPPSISCGTAGGYLDCNPLTIPGPDNSSVTVDGGCEPVVVTNDGGTTTHVGVNYTFTIVYTASDDCGQSDNCSQVYTYVLDTEAPSITGCAEGGPLGCNPASIPAADDHSVIATDNSGSVTVTHDNGVETGSGCAKTFTRTYTATDGCGKTATCEQVFTYTVDTEDPKINCPSPITVGECHNTVTFTVTGSDNCGTPSIVSTPQSGSVFPVGETTVRAVATDACGRTSTCSFTVTVIANPTVGITADGPTTFCEGGSVNLSALGATSYEWSGPGVNDGNRNDNPLEVFESGNYSVVGTDNQGCTDGSNTISVTVNPNPSCEINDFTDSPLPGGTYSLSAVVNGAGCTPTLAWSSNTTDANGNPLVNSWTINGSNSVNPVSFKGGAMETVGHFSLTVTCAATGCHSNCNLDITSQAMERCAYTQGFYGNNNGQNGGFATCVGLRVADAINQALHTNGGVVSSVCNPIVVGYGSSKILTVGCSSTDINCLITRMPGGGTAAAFTTTSPVLICNANGTAWVDNKTKFKNVLLGQTMALSINLRLFNNLGSVPITAANFTTYESSACTNGNIIPGTGQAFTIPACIITYLNCTGKKTVKDLLCLANQALSNAVPSACNGTKISLSDINAAVDAVNRGFDKCRITANQFIREGEITFSNSPTNFGFMAFPNPTSGSTAVTFIASADGEATFEVFDAKGSLVSRTVKGDIKAGMDYKMDVNTVNFPAGIYFMRLTSGDEVATGKLVVTKQ